MIHFFVLQYNIKKKEEVTEQQETEPPNPLMRKKKTPEELAREAEAEDEDDFTSNNNSTKWLSHTCFICFFQSLLMRPNIYSSPFLHSQSRISLLSA